jgi:hypothetical protein
LKECGEIGHHVSTVLYKSIGERNGDEINSYIRIDGTPSNSRRMEEVGFDGTWVYLR